MARNFFSLGRSRLVFGGGAAFLLGVAVLVALAALQLHNDAIETVRKESGRLGIVLAEQTTSTLQAADIEVSQILSEIAANKVSNSADLREKFGSIAGLKGLQRHLTNLPQLESFAIIDALGQVVTTTRAWPTPEINVADRGFYHYLKNNNDTASRVSEPVRNRADGGSTFYLSRRINAPDGSFLAVVNASIRISYFKDLYKRLGLEQDTTITLLHKDGIVITGYPQDAASSGPQLPQPQPFSDAVANGGGFYIRDGIFEDGNKRLVSVNPLQSYPIVINVVRSEWQALAQWRRQAMKRGAGLACVLTAFLALLFFLNRQFVALEDARARIAERTEALTLSTEQLATQAHVLQSTLDNMSDGLIMVGAIGQVVVFNNRAIKLLNLPSELMETKPTFEKISKYQHESGEFENTNDALRRQFAHDHRSSLPLAYERERPDGTILEVRSVMLPDGGMLRTYSDVTQNRRQSMQMREAQRFESLGRLAGGIAHDFNNLLATIGLVAEMLAVDHCDRPKLVDRANVIGAAVESGSGLIRRLLAYSQEQALTPQSLDLARYLADHIALVRHTIGDSISVTADIPPDLPAVKADPSQVGDALLNIAINARDAMPQGGKLSIRARYDSDPSSRTAGLVVLCVSDTGTGMSAETLAHATEPFFTTKPFGKGTGLGLSMVEGFVRQSGGRLRIQSALGKGTTISISLPCFVGTPRRTVDVPIDAPRGTERLLIVDDNESIRQSLVHVLGGLGYDVSVASSGPDAILRLADSGPFDLLLTDLTMPDGMSGIDLAERAHLRWPGMPILLMSGNAPLDLRNRLLRELQVLNKPFKKYDLAAAVRLALSSMKDGANQSATG
jgi:signal transduction histidine kinase/CheY-like chemotaxis protein